MTPERPLANTRWSFFTTTVPSPSTETSCSQKLAVEHQKYEELEQQHQTMQGELKRQLQVSEESSCQTLAQLTQLYDTQLEEKTKVLAQVRGHTAPTPAPAISEM